MGNLHSEALKMGNAILVSSEGSGRDIPRDHLSARETAPLMSGQDGANTGIRAWLVDPVCGPSKFAVNPVVAVKDLRQERSKLRHRRLGKEPGDGFDTRSDDMIRCRHGGMIVVLSLSHVGPRVPKTAIRRPRSLP